MGKTITEKIFETHIVDRPFSGTSVLSLDVVMCHEITTPIAITDLQARGKDRVFDPKTRVPGRNCAPFPPLPNFPAKRRYGPCRPVPPSPHRA